MACEKVQNYKFDVITKCTNKLDVLFFAKVAN